MDSSKNLKWIIPFKKFSKLKVTPVYKYLNKIGNIILELTTK